MKIRAKIPQWYKSADVEDAIGDLVEGEGVYLGRYELRDGAGKSLGKIFNVYAAPEDLTDESDNGLLLYEDALKTLSAKKNWHGFDGEPFEEEMDMWRALVDGSYKGGWFIPSRELLVGCLNDAREGHAGRGDITQKDNLFDARKKGVLKGTFSDTKEEKYDYRTWYWSSSRSVNGSVSYRWGGSFACESGAGAWYYIKNFRFRCRPVRLVEIKPKP